jgi:CubicO group peptidase (beta-lactamase class C family)
VAAHLHKIAAPADLPPLRFLLTFGDGPSIRSEPTPTSQVLKTLASSPVQPGIKAIFFVQTRTANGGGTPQGHELMQRELADSNIGYALIGMAIEARTGRPLNALLAEKVLAPLGVVSQDVVHRNAQP